MPDVQLDVSPSRCGPAVWRAVWTSPLPMRVSCPRCRPKNRGFRRYVGGDDLPTGWRPPPDPGRILVTLTLGRVSDVHPRSGLGRRVNRSPSVGSRADDPRSGLATGHPRSGLGRPPCRVSRVNVRGGYPRSGLATGHPRSGLGRPPSVGSRTSRQPVTLGRVSDVHPRSGLGRRLNVRAATDGGGKRGDGTHDHDNRPGRDGHGAGASFAGGARHYGADSVDSTPGDQRRDGRDGDPAGSTRGRRGQWHCSFGAI